MVAQKPGFLPRQGGALSNTPPPNSKRTYCGIDTLHASFGVEWPELEFAALAARMQTAKEAANPEDGEGGEATELEFEGRIFTTLATGATMGNGKNRGPTFAFRFEHAGMVILVMRRHTPSGETPNVRVQVGAVACLDAKTPAVLFNQVRSVVGAMGGRVLWSKVSRCDVFVDVENQDVAEVVRAHHDDRTITRAMNKTTYESAPDGDHGAEVFWKGRKTTGLRIGAGMKFRAYDKRAELEVHPLKFEAWCVGEWDGDAPEVCTRFEFQLNRDALKTFGLDREAFEVTEGVEASRKATDELERLHTELGGLCRYLTHRWLRFAAVDVDRTNTSRVEVAEFWAVVQSSLGSWSMPEGDLDREVVRSRASISHLASMVIGCTETMAAIKGRDVETMEQLAAFGVEQLIAVTYGDVDLAERCGRMVESVLRRAVSDEHRQSKENTHDVARAVGEKRQGTDQDLAYPRGTLGVHERTAE